MLELFKDEGLVGFVSVRAGDSSRDPDLSVQQGGRLHGVCDQSCRATFEWTLRARAVSAPRAH
jgi:hypothetical protein